MLKNINADCQRWQPVVGALGPAIFDSHVPAFEGYQQLFFPLLLVGKPKAPHSQN
jgi:hypothetical protein